MQNYQSLPDAVRHAARLGATVEVGGRVLNSGAHSAAVGARARANPAPAAPMPQQPSIAAAIPPAPAADPDLLPALTRLIAQQGSAVSLALATMAEKMAPPPIPEPTPMRPVSFAVVRGDSGRAVSLAPVYGEGVAEMPSAFQVIKDESGMTTEIIPVY